jgi:hypothetical protein
MFIDIYLKINIIIMNDKKILLLCFLFIFIFNQNHAKAGEYFNVSVVDEYFCVYITNPATLELAYKDYRGEIRRIVSGNLSGGNGGFNQPWSWHLVPDSVRLVEMAVEICDGKPSFVEKDLENWLKIGIYCPWVSDIIKIGCAGITPTTTTQFTSTTTTRPTTTTTTIPTTTSSVTTTTTTTTTIISSCSGPLSLSLSPNPVWAYQTVKADSSGLINCDGKTVYVGIGQYEVLRCWCTVSGSGCSCNFTAPNPFTSNISYTFSARIDKNSDRDYTDPGEKANTTLTIWCKALNQPCSQSETCCSPNYCINGVCKYSGGGGCPVLKVWDGNSYKDVVKLDIHSEKGRDTTTSIGFSMKPKDGKYNVKLSEIWYAFWEGSHIDSVQMTDKSGKECKLVSAVHNKKGDVLTAIAKSDDVRVETKPGEEIDLVFSGCSGEEFVFSIEGYNAIPRLAKLALSQGNIIIIIVTLITVIVIVYGAFKFFAKRK